MLWSIPIKSNKLVSTRHKKTMKQKSNYLWQIFYTLILQKKKKRIHTVGSKIVINSIELNNIKERNFDSSMLQDHFRSHYINRFSVSGLGIYAHTNNYNIFPK